MSECGVMVVEYWVMVVVDLISQWGDGGGGSH
jgi:hypothetical protein